MSLESESDRILNIGGNYQEKRRGSNKKQTIQTFKSLCVTDFLFVWETWLDNVVAVHLGRLGMHPTHTPKPHILLPVCHVEISMCLATYILYCEVSYDIPEFCPVSVFLRVCVSE